MGFRSPQSKAAWILDSVFDLRHFLCTLQGYMYIYKSRLSVKIAGFSAISARFRRLLQLLREQLCGSSGPTTVHFSETSGYFKPYRKPNFVSGPRTVVQQSAWISAFWTNFLTLVLRAWKRIRASAWFLPTNKIEVPFWIHSFASLCNRTKFLIIVCSIPGLSAVLSL